MGEMPFSDGLDDVVSFTRSNGNAMVALSTGSAFAAPTLFGTGLASSTFNAAMGDVDGDERADAVVFAISPPFAPVVAKTNN